MDFNAFDARGAADEGRPLHVVHPLTGEKLFDGDKPCIVMVLGMEGRTAQAAAKGLSDKDKLGEKATLNDLHERLCDMAAPLVVGFSGINNGERAAVAPQDVHWFLDLQIADPLQEGKGRSFVEQVLNFARDRANYLGEFVAASAEPRNKSAGSTRAPKVKSKPVAK